MDERYDKEEAYSERQRPRRGETEKGHFPVREDKRQVYAPKKTDSSDRRSAERESYEETRIPRRESYEETRIPRRESYEETRIPRRESYEETRIPRRESYEETRIPRRERREGTESRSRQEKAGAASDNRERRSDGRRENPQMQQKKGRRRGRKKLSGFTKKLLVLLIALVIGLLAFQFMKGMMTSGNEPLELTGETVTVTIPEGASTTDIARVLKENKLIKSVFLFRITSKLDGFDGTYKQGTYEVDKGMTTTQMMELLQSGVVLQEQKITIPEGYTVKQIAQKAEEAEICTAEEFIGEVNHGEFDYEFLKDLPDREYRLEGYLFPDTYYISKNMTAHDLVDMMLRRFGQIYTEKYQKAVESSGYTLDQIVTVASMVEKEIKVDEERARAAGVIYNRLKEDMSLGIDATVLYAVGKSGGELTQADLQTDSPYNTRLNKGLPLGPICNPGEAALKAAIEPEKNDYLYYVVEAQGKNNHLFFKTYDEFLAAKANYAAGAE